MREIEDKTPVDTALREAYEVVSSFFIRSRNFLALGNWFTRFSGSDNHDIAPLHVPTSDPSLPSISNSNGLLHTLHRRRSG